MFLENLISAVSLMNLLEVTDRFSLFRRRQRERALMNRFDRLCRNFKALAKLFNPKFIPYLFERGNRLNF